MSDREEAGMHLPYADEKIEGVRVERYGEPSSLPSLLFVHGGTQGSWAWEHVARDLAGRGWHSSCLNWFGHHGSDALAPAEARERSIMDVTREIRVVADRLPDDPVLIAHSMGGLAALAYASKYPVKALVLLTPVVPGKHAGAEIPLPIDPSTMWLIPAEALRQVFWDAVGDDEAQRYASLVVPESPRAVIEATRWTVDLDVSSITAPAYLLGAERDSIIPHEFVESLAEEMGAEYDLLPEQGHGVILNPIREEVAARISRWLDKTVR
ncbi:alpha/beta hydrolase [Pseudonocardia xinjiangensis]|uniref:alpha/beta hydrolase n=1 Tax=Pseudonocardia xinjiangensis TaxID=75289 RepID=UPI003D8CE6B5